MLRCHSCRCVSSKVSMVFASLKVLLVSGYRPVQLFKSWNPTPKLEHLGSKKYQFIHKISTTISQHNWHQIKENFTKFQGKGEKKKHENMQYEKPYISPSQFHRGPKLFGFLPGLPQDTKGRTVTDGKLWMWEMYKNMFGNEMKINQSRCVVSGILGWWMYKCSILLRGFVDTKHTIRWTDSLVGTTDALRDDKADLLLFLVFLQLSNNWFLP